MKRIQQVSLSLFLLLCLLLSACGAAPGGTQTSFSLEDVPAFSGEPYVVLSDNQPDFTQEELDQAAHCIKMLGGRVEPVMDYPVPGAGVTHRLIPIRKVAPTLKGYPRRWAKIQKNPL